MIAEPLEVEVEAAWHSLTRANRPRTVYLSSGHRLVWGSRADQVEHRWEVGTYRRTVTLAEFRDDVFFVFDQRGRK